MSGALSEHQSGFRKGHSTTTCLAEFLDVIYVIYSGVLFLDLQKAFNMVDHHILLCKLEEMGLGEIYVNLLENYLRNRFQITKIENALSDKLPIICGVLQGSILGPLLFIIYINSLPSAIPENVKTFLYADDTALVASGADLHSVSESLNVAITSASSWFHNHRLSLHVSKTKSMCFGTQGKLNITGGDLNISLNNDPIDAVTKFKYLGITLDRHLSFDLHIDSLCRKVIAKMKMMGRVRQYISERLAIQMYTTLILPDFDYGDTIYGGM